MMLCVQGAVTNILEEEIVQPLLVSTSAITLATETVRSILKIDDIVSVYKLILWLGYSELLTGDSKYSLQDLKLLIEIHQYNNL